MSAQVSGPPRLAGPCDCRRCRSVSLESRLRAAVRQGDLVLTCGHSDGVRLEGGEIRCHVCRALAVWREGRRVAS